MFMRRPFGQHPAARRFRAHNQIVLAVQMPGRQQCDGPAPDLAACAVARAGEDMRILPFA
jgi:hypothetical protein